MKKIITLVLVTVCTISMSFAAAGKQPVNDKVMSSFKQAFASAGNVTWRQLGGEDLYKASFDYNNEKVEAFYNAEGEMVATARYITLKQLPLAVVQSLRENYDTYIPEQEVVEYSDAGETAYYVRLAGKKAVVTVKAAANGDLSVFKKEKRKV